MINYSNDFYSQNTDHISLQQGFLEAVDSHITDSSGVPLIEDHEPL